MDVGDGYMYLDYMSKILVEESGKPRSSLVF